MEPDLQEEVISLREANKGLTLYVSKILDRIIAREGYENILAADGGNEGGKRSMRGGAGTVGRRAKRASILPINRNANADVTGASELFQQQQQQQHLLPSPLISPPPSSSSQTDRSTKQQSISILGFGRASASDASLDPSSAAGAGGASGLNRSASKRTSSVDWRGLFPSGSSSPQPQQQQQQQSGSFRPLTLSSTLGGSRNSSSSGGSGTGGAGPSPSPGLAPSSAASVQSTGTAGSGGGSVARKVDTHEDDDDVAERERIRAALQLEGIVTPAHQLRQPSPQSSISAASGSNNASNVAGTRTSGAWGLISRVMSTSSAASGGAGGSPNPQTGSPALDSGGFGFQPGPRLTTFDDPAPARPQQQGAGSLEEQRRMALQASAPSSGAALTEAPARAPTARFSRRSLAATAPASPGGSTSMTASTEISLASPAKTRQLNRSGSVAGDESYIMPSRNVSGASSAANSAEGEQDEEEPGWKRALKRVSLLTAAASGSPAAR